MFRTYYPYFLVILGLASLLQLFPEIFRAIEVFGAIYLVFIAYTILRINKKREKSNERKESYFVTGFIMNLSNPKVSLFLLVFSWFSFLINHKFKNTICSPW